MHVCIYLIIFLLNQFRSLLPYIPQLKHRWFATLLITCHYHCVVATPLKGILPLISFPSLMIGFGFPHHN